MPRSDSRSVDRRRKPPPRRDDSRRRDSRDRGRGRSDSRGGRSWQQKMYDRYNVDEAAQRKLGMLPPEQADTLLRNLETGNIRNPSAFIMKAVNNALDQKKGSGRGDRGDRDGGRGGRDGRDRDGRDGGRDRGRYASRSRSRSRR